MSINTKSFITTYNYLINDMYEKIPWEPLISSNNLFRIKILPKFSLEMTTTKWFRVKQSPLSPENLIKLKDLAND